MIAAGLLGLLVAIALMVVRALRGPSVFDRLVAASSLGNAAILILALFGFFTGRPEFLDIAITYALLNMIGIYAVLKFVRFGALGAAGEEGEAG